MNNRIQELWRFSVLNNTKTPMNWQLVADEFALLIVRECIKVIDDKPIFGSLPIKEHFGVEE